MRYFTTSIKAIDPKTGEIKSWCGPNIPAISFEDAQSYCDNNGLGYCKIEDELIAEIDADENGNAIMNTYKSYENLN